MDNIPIITGDRFDGLKQTIEGMTEHNTLKMIRDMVKDFLQQFYDGISKLLTTMSFESLTSPELAAIAVVMGMVALLQVYLSLT